MKTMKSNACQLMCQTVIAVSFLSGVAAAADTSPKPATIPPAAPAPAPSAASAFPGDPAPPPTTVMQTITTIHLEPPLTRAQMKEESAQGSAGIAGAVEVTPEFRQMMRVISASMASANSGDQLGQNGKWQEAAQSYQQALDVWPGNTAAIYGLAKCAGAAGDRMTAIGYCRKVMYSTDAMYSADPLHPVLIETDPARLMELALLLSQTGQDAEALMVYRRGAGFINFDHGKPCLGFNVPYWHLDTPALVKAGKEKVYYVFLPNFSPGWTPYTPQRLQGMIHLGLGIESQIDSEKLYHFQEAVRLYPESAVAWYYLAGQLADRGGMKHQAEARADFLKARSLGDPSVQAISDSYLRDIYPYTIPAGP